MGRLELPIPDLGGPMDKSAEDMQMRIRNQVPEKFRATVIVKPFRRGKKTGLEILYDDRIENSVFAAIEYPQGSGREEALGPE